MSETYDLLLKRREDVRAWIAKAQADLADIEKAIAAIEPREAPKLAIADRGTCRHCGGPIVHGGPTGWIHDRDGGAPCKPGHSGPVAEPLDHTTQWSAVPPARQGEDVTEALSAVNGDLSASRPAEPEGQPT